MGNCTGEDARAYISRKATGCLSSGLIANVLYCEQKLRRRSPALIVHARAHVHSRIFPEGVQTAGPVNTDAHVKGVVIGGFIGGCMNGTEPIEPPWPRAEIGAGRSRSTDDRQEEP